MIKKNLFSLLIVFLLAPLANASESPIGQWKTIDEKTGKAKAIVEISETDGVLFGKIVKLFNPSEPNPLCKKCKAEKADQPILGLEILWGLKRKDEYWGGGKILDPKKGKTYKAKITLIEGGTKLKMRGYVGSPALGRTQVWERIN